jgi:hypothetical protein
MPKSISMASYLVINVYTSAASAIVYVFLADDEKDEGKAIIPIFKFLKTVNYSLHELLIWLSKWHRRACEPKVCRR